MHLMLSYYSLSVEGEISHETQLEQIDNSFKEVNSASDVVLVEGTGHCAVGSIVNANNGKSQHVVSRTYRFCEFTIILGCVCSYYPSQTGLLTLSMTPSTEVVYCATTLALGHY